MHRRLSYKSAGSGLFSREDASETDPALLSSANEFMPVPGCQSIVQDNISSSGTPSTSDFSREQIMVSSRPSERPFSGAPLSLRTMTTAMSMPEISYRDRADTDSPTAQMQYLPTPPFPVLRHASMEEHTSSPRTERLPSFRQLSKIADHGTDGPENRTTSYPALPTHPPTMVAQSPAKALPYFTGSQQSSPTATFAMLNNPSPTHVRPDSQDAFGIPPSPVHNHYPLPDQNRFSSRRRSFGSAKAPPPLTSASSNDTNVSHQSSGADSYTTSSTTPIDHLEGVSHSNLPHPLGMQHSPPAGGVFVCEYPGCNAPAFQTQYLLNSHANVHSSNRPHYCPVKGCPRGEGGKGFKRKNEMIRHGLVHDSPGYVCPFCPLREHKYPRPDNLQRHVRVHHVDKDKDDPLLREVLSQRPEGGTRGRRRRTGP